MKTKYFFSVILVLCSMLHAPCQVPQGFNYQAIARDGSGNPVTGTTIKIKLSILSDTTGFYGGTGGTYIWEEEHTGVVTNSFGMFTIVLGSPAATKVQGSAASFSSIDWSNPNLFVGTKIAVSPAYVYKVLGSTKLWSVPYALRAKETEQWLTSGSNIYRSSGNVGIGTSSPTGRLSVQPTISWDDNIPLFEVRNKIGVPVLAVYNNGVRVLVEDTDGKGVKGGFAIGGFDPTKAGGETNNFMMISADSIRFYVDKKQTKGVKGGFAIGGFDGSKAGKSTFFDVSPYSGDIISAENRILWYPIKNSFLTGRIVIESPDSVGENSFSSGYESKAIGNWSQSLGYKTASRGNYSTSIGRSSVAKGDNSFAFGNQAYAKGEDSYAFGSGAYALGNASFALGSSKVDSTGNTVHTVASADGAFALGFGSVASDLGAFSMGVLDTAAGLGSLSMGYYNKSLGWFSTTFGAGNTVEPFGFNALATGVWTRAAQWAAASFGDQTYASGHTSFATGFKTVASGQLSATFGDQTIAPSYGSVAIGRYNDYSGTSNQWNSWDPLFMAGNGSSATSRSNALTLYKNGNMDLAGTINLNLGVPMGIAMRVNNSEALWYNGTYFSWGYGGTYNYFARKVTIGYGAEPSYMLYVQGSAYSTGGWSGSDERWKKNLEPFRNVLPGVLSLNCYRYDWRTEEYPEMHFDKDKQVGLIAQEVEKIFPDLVRTDNNGYKAISYEKLSVILAEAIKEQQEQIENYRNENLQLKTELKMLKDRIDKMESALTVIR